jgi:amylosucrase
MLGGVCYVDLFAGDLQQLRTKVPYFQELGLTYLHLMPLFAAPEGDNDGGYAVSDYRAVDPRLGSMEDLRALAQELRAQASAWCWISSSTTRRTSTGGRWPPGRRPGIRRLLFHFPRPHDARRLRTDAARDLPRQASGRLHLSGERSTKWVWTTFNIFQWDLNYSNPMTFREHGRRDALPGQPRGTEVLRLDAVAFIWKELGTACESLPKGAHAGAGLQRAAAHRRAEPALQVGSHRPPRRGRALHQHRRVPALLQPAADGAAVEQPGHAGGAPAAPEHGHRFKIADDCAWVNYVRCHDDIGWTFDDSDAAALGINGYDHRRFLNAFYTGRFAGSFARGLPFQENPRTGDARISGMLASLAGLEAALHGGDGAEIELAVRRICLLNAIILSIGGIPLFYLNDEIGALNDYSYVDDPAKAGDSRWVHRPATDWARMERRHDPATLEGRIYARLRHLIQVRKATRAFAGNQMQVINVGSDHIFGYVRTGPEGQRAVVLANFTERPQSLHPNEVRLYGLGYQFRDLVEGRVLALGEQMLTLEPYQVVWLTAE